MDINMGPNSELQQSIVNVPDIVPVPDIWIHQAKEFQRGDDDVHLRYTGSQD